jgi:hypothetical protein
MGTRNRRQAFYALPEAQQAGSIPTGESGNLQKLFPVSESGGM